MVAWASRVSIESMRVTLSSEHMFVRRGGLYMVLVSAYVTRISSPAATASSSIIIGRPSHSAGRQGSVKGITWIGVTAQSTVSWGRMMQPPSLCEPAYGGIR